MHSNPLFDAIRSHDHLLNRMESLPAPKHPEHQTVHLFFMLNKTEKCINAVISEGRGWAGDRLLKDPLVLLLSRLNHCLTEEKRRILRSMCQPRRRPVLFVAVVDLVPGVVALVCERRSDALREERLSSETTALRSQFKNSRSQNESVRRTHIFCLVVYMCCCWRGGRQRRWCYRQTLCPGTGM